MPGHLDMVIDGVGGVSGGTVASLVGMLFDVSLPSSCFPRTKPVQCRCACVLRFFQLGIEKQLERAELKGICGRETGMFLGGKGGLGGRRPHWASRMGEAAAGAAPPCPPQGIGIVIA